MSIYIALAPAAIFVALLARRVAQRLSTWHLYALALALPGCCFHTSADKGDASIVNCPALTHQQRLLVAEPDGSETCLPGDCDPGWNVCGSPEGGCQTDISTSENCGACGYRCDSLHMCDMVGDNVFACIMKGPPPHT